MDEGLRLRRHSRPSISVCLSVPVDTSWARRKKEQAWLTMLKPVFLCVCVCVCVFGCFVFGRNLENNAFTQVVTEALLGVPNLVEL